jgi:hypothetical protein
MPHCGEEELLAVFCTWLFRLLGKTGRIANALTLILKLRAHNVANGTFPAKCPQIKRCEI